MMRISQISVTKLFGIFDHTIPLNMDSRITIMYGLNGFGKTTLLKMMYGILNRRYSIFRTIPFQNFVVRFDNGERLEVDTTQVSPAQLPLFLEDKVLNNAIKISLYSYDSEVRERATIRLSDADDLERETPDSLKRIREIISNLIPDLERISINAWRNIKNGEIYGLAEVFDIYGDQLPFSDLTFSRDILWLDELRKQAKVKLIESQRLSYLASSKNRVRDIDSKSQLAVKMNSDRIVRTIQNKLAEYATSSQQLDRTFPLRLMNMQTEKLVKTDNLRKKLEALEQERSRLMDAGLLDREADVNTPIISDELNNVLSLYIQDVEEKLSVFSDLLEKLELFQEIINERFQYKHLRVDKTHGFTFTSDIGSQIPLDNLSSGEQHELILLYQLLFEVQPDTLVMIDEPELSLHVTWQRRFLDDLEKITALGKFDVLLATHSPQIIGERDDLTVALERPEVHA